MSETHSARDPVSAAGDVPDPQSSTPELEDLLAECLDLLEMEGEAALEERLAAVPEHAAELRERLAMLSALGFLSPAKTQVLPRAAGGVGTDGSERPAMPLEQVGDYRIVDWIGSGGMGVVYLAEQVGLGRRVALKILPQWALCPESEREWFRREARVIAQLDHPNCVRVLAAGEDQGFGWIAMEYVDGESLDRRLQRLHAAGQRLAVVDVLSWGRDIARALQAAHECGVVHRDVKPGNIRITPDGRARLLDFGMAWCSAEGWQTRSMGFRGSPYYASPEQVRGDRAAIGPATDVYGLGVTLFECLSGQLPFAGETTEQVFHNVLTAAPPSLARVRRDLPRELVAVLEKAIEKRPPDRYPSAGEFAADLEAVQEFRPVRARRPGPLRRLRGFVRHRPRTAAAALAVLLGLLSASIALGVDASRRSAARRQLASDALDEARDGVDEITRLSERFERIAIQRGEESQRLARRGRSDNWDRVHQRITDQTEQLFGIRVRIRQLEQAIREQLVRARSGRLDEHAIRRVEASMFRRLAEFAAALDGAGGQEELDHLFFELDQEFYRGLALERDPEGRLASVLDPQHQLRLVAARHDTELHLFRLERLRDLEPGADRRIMPVPLHGLDDPRVRPGMRGLRITADGAGLEAGAFVFAVDGVPLSRPESSGGRASLRLAMQQLAAGGVTVTAWHRGQVVEQRLAARTRSRPTAAPLLFGPGSRVGVGEFARTLPEGHYVAVGRRVGCPDLVRAFHLISSRQVVLDPRPRSEALRGFVPVAAEFAGEPKRYWLQERETSCAEYLAFLNDPEVFEGLSDDALELVPRTNASGTTRALWQRTPNGYLLPEGCEGEQPVVGISWDDARAYAAWRSRNAAPPGLEFALPTWTEWFQAVQEQHPGPYPWGRHFRPVWTNSCYARREVGVVPSFSFAEDETPIGLYDTAGNVSEWLDDWFNADRAQRLQVGGNWGESGPRFFSVTTWWGARAEAFSGTVGFRLVARPR